MRKKIAVLACTVALALCMPVLAFGATNDSTQAGTDTAPNESTQAGTDTATDKPTYSSPHGIVGNNFKEISPDADGLRRYSVAGMDYDSSDEKFFYVTVKTTNDKAIDKLEYTTEKAKNFEEGDYVAVQSFIIESDAFATGQDRVTIAWQAPIGTGENIMCKIFIEHSDGTVDAVDGSVDKDGNVVLEMDKLSIITFALTKVEGGTQHAVVLSADTKSVSPKTGGIEL